MIRTTFTILLIAILSVSFGQVLEKFDFSDCMAECIGDSTRIDTIFQTNDITEISLTAYANCNGNLEGQIKLTNDTLNLTYSPKVTRIKNKKTGKIEEYYEVAMCDCIFEFNYKISGLQTLDKSKIKINGETLEKINARLIREETTEITFEVDSTWSSDDIFVVVENPAQFPGGMSKFKEYIDKNLEFPKDNKSKGISGKVFVEIIINKDGSIDDSSIRVLRGLNKSCNNKAIRLMQECPDWIPGTIKGQPVKQKYVVPITFNTQKTLKR